MSVTQHPGVGAHNGYANGRSDVKDLLRQLASEISGQIAEVDRRHAVAMRDMEARLDAVAVVKPTTERAAPSVAVPPVGPAPEAPPAFGPYDPSEAWDPEAAEALTRLYEHEPAGPAVFFADPPVASAPVPAAPVPAAPAVNLAAAQPAAPLAVSASASAPTQAVAPQPTPLIDLADDRRWLEDRFADIAGRVDQSLRAFDPAARLAPLGQRIDTLESNLNAALADVVRRDAFAGLEKQVGDVRGQLDATRTQLKRLDGIESELRKLSHVAEAAAAQTGHPEAAPAAFVMPDFEALALKAAEQTRAAVQMPDVEGMIAKAADAAAERMHARQPDGAAGVAPQAIDGLKAQLETYIGEYRREQAQTASALSTMQDALIGLIDRIEQATAGDDQAESDAQYVESVDERSGGPGRRAADQARMPAAPVPATAPVAAHRPAAMPEHAAVPQAAATPRRPVAPEAFAAEPAMAPTDPGTRRTAPRRDVPTLDAASAAEAMAAERARVAAERAAASAPNRRPVMTVAADAEDATQPKTSRAPRKAAPAGAAKRGLMIAGIAALMIGAGAAAFMILPGRFAAAPQKFEERIEPIAPAKPAAQRPAVPNPSATPAAATETPAARVPAPQPVPREQPQPQAAPGAAAPPAQPLRRTSPETVTDDLSANTQPGEARPSFVETMGVRVSKATVQGITVDGGAMLPDPAELARRQARMAPPAQATDVAAPTPQAATPAIEPVVPGRIPAIELPPLMVGPQSMRLAAQQGDPGAQFEVAARLAEGKGLKQDFAQAMTWYTRAAQKGFVPAQYRVATLYERGLGVEADVGRAKAWYGRAAEQGNVKAMHNLAVLAAGPQSGEPDYATAGRWFTEAAERGLADSQFNLGVLAENGLGVNKDPRAAYKWFALAARSGDKEAARRRDQIFATMTPEQAKSAEQIVAGWRAKPTDLKANDARAATQAWRAENDARLQALAEQQAQQAEQQVQGRPAPKAASGPLTVPPTQVKAPKLPVKAKVLNP